MDTRALPYASKLTSPGMSARHSLSPMFSLLKGLWEYWFRVDEFPVLMLGLDNAGKSTLLERLKTMYGGGPGLPADRITPTVGLNIAKLEIGKARMTLWDLGGQSELRSIWDKYYADALGLIFVIDCTTRNRFEEVSSVLSKVLTNPDAREKPVLFLLNKQDSESCLPVHDVTTEVDLVALASSTNSHVQPCIGLTGEGLSQGMSWLMTQLKKGAGPQPEAW